MVMNNNDEINEYLHSMAEAFIQDMQEYHVSQSQGSNYFDKYNSDESVMQELDIIRNNVNSIDDIGKIEELQDQNTDEISMYNKLLADMIVLVDRFSSDEITRIELAESIIIPIRQILRICAKYNLDKTADDNYILSRDELLKLRALYIGINGIIKARKIELAV
jgi:hypothetical protein